MNTSVFPIFWLVILLLSIIGRSTGKKKSKSSSGSAAAPTPRINRDYARKSKDDDCDYGEVNHKYSHESESRIKQLDSYLKAGLIDKKEYAQMLARYKKAERDFENYE